MKDKISKDRITGSFPSMLFILAAMLLTVSVEAQQKILERSSPAYPEWMMHHPEGYLVCMSEGPTLAAAQNLLEQELLRQIAGAAAVYIHAETSADSGKEGDYEWDNFRNTVTATIARLPFISDVTLAKCKDIYWDHTADKTSGKHTYRMTALYPFASDSRQKLIDQYKAYDAGLEKSLLRLEEDWAAVNSSSEISKSESELAALAESFPDTNRRMRSLKALELYRSIRKSLSLEADIEEKGICRLRVMRGEMPFHVDARLDVTSECASDIKVRKDSEGWTIRFNTDDCIEDEPNSLKITLRDNGVRLKTSVSF